MKEQLLKRLALVGIEVQTERHKAALAELAKVRAGLTVKRRKLTPDQRRKQVEGIRRHFATRRRANGHLHWTQRPENHAKVVAMARKGAATKNRKSA